MMIVFSLVFQTFLFIHCSTDSPACHINFFHVIFFVLLQYLSSQSVSIFFFYLLSLWSPLDQCVVIGQPFWAKYHALYSVIRG